MTFEFLALITVLASAIGAVVGLLVSLWVNRRDSDPEETPIPLTPPDPFVSAEIDQAAARWASRQGQPEAAGVVADKLHMLYELARRRGES